MSVLVEVVRNVLVIIIVASLLEMLLPEGSTRPFVRFAVGLFILIAVLNPVLTAVFARQDLEISWWDSRADYRGEMGYVEEKGQRLQEEVLRQSGEMAREKLQGQISAMATLVPGVAEVKTEARVDARGAVKKLKLVVRPERPPQTDGEGKNPGVFFSSGSDLPEEEKEQIRTKMSGILQQFYGLDGVNIEIQFEGG